MSRPRKQTVDYFPHICRHGKTMLILEQKYGNDGYAFWFKLLEMLGDSPGHFLDCNDAMTWEFLQVKTRLSDVVCREVLNLLSKLEAIDPDLWQKNIIWSDNFITGIAEVYRNRRVDIPARPDNYTPKPRQDDVSTSSLQTENRIVEESREEKSKGEERKENTLARARGKKSNSYSEDFQKFWDAYPKQKVKPNAWQEWQAMQKAGRLPLLTDLLNILETQKAWPSWIEDGGKYIPYPERWIKKERWHDQEPTVRRLGKTATNNIANAEALREKWRQEGKL